MEVSTFLVRKENLYVDLVQFCAGYLGSRLFLRKKINPLIAGNVLVVQSVTLQIFQFFEKSKHTAKNKVKKKFTSIKNYIFVVHLANFLVTNKIFRFSFMYTTASIGFRETVQRVYESFEKAEYREFRYRDNKNI